MQKETINYICNNSWLGRAIDYPQEIDIVWSFQTR
jgi:hypothetical protein